MKKNLLILFAFAMMASLNLKAQENSTHQTKFRIALNGGYSYRLAKVADNTPSDLKEYVKGLKSGYNLGLDAHYFISSWGFGATYNMFNASNSIANVQVIYLNGNTASGNLRDDVTIQFIGPSIANRYITASQKHIFVSALAIGYVNYKDDVTFAGQNKITGSTLGGGFDFAYDYQIAKKIYIGAKLAFVGGVIKKITYTVDDVTTTKELEKDKYENLSRLDISAGIKFNL